MATVLNISNHSVDLHGGRVLAPNDKANVDISLPQNTALLTAGLIVVTDANAAPAPAVPPAATDFRRIRKGKGAAPDEIVDFIQLDGEQYPRRAWRGDGTPLAGDGSSPLTPESDRALRKGQPVELALATFPSGHGWVGSGAGSVSDVGGAGNFINNDRSLKIQTDGLGGVTVATKTGLGPFDLIGKHARVQAAYASGSARLTYFKLRLASGDIATNYAEATIADQSDASMFQGGTFVAQSYALGDFTVVGTVDWSRITSAQLRAADNGSGNSAVHVATISAIPALSRGAVSIAFDDGYASVFLNALKRMSRYRMPATSYVISDLIDAGTGAVGGFMTLAQLESLRDNHDWEIGGHAFKIANHNLTNGLQDLNDTDANTEFTGLRTWMTDRGFEPITFAYPKGAFGGSVLKYSKRDYRAARGIAKGPETFPARSRWQVRGYSINGQTQTLADVKAVVDKAIASKTWAILTFHDLVAGSPAAATEFRQSDFDALVDYIASTGVLVRTVADMVRQPAP